jgi:hypothetical protein
MDFFFDPSAIDWPRYVCDVHLPGVKRNVKKLTSGADQKTMHVQSASR